MNNFAIKYYTNLNFIDILSVLCAIKRENVRRDIYYHKLYNRQTEPRPTLRQPSPKAANVHNRW